MKGKAVSTIHKARRVTRGGLVVSLMFGLIATLLPTTPVFAQTASEDPIVGVWEHAFAGEVTVSATGPASFTGKVTASPGESSCWRVGQELWTITGKTGNTYNGTVQWFHTKDCSDRGRSAGTFDMNDTQSSLTVCSKDPVDGHEECFSVSKPAPDSGRISSATFPLSERTDKAKKELQAEIDTLIAARLAKDDEIDLLQRTVERLVEDHRFYLARVRSWEAEISEFRQDVYDGISKEDSEEMRRLLRGLKNAQLDEWALRLRLENRENDLRAALGDREEIVRQILEKVDPMEALDFELTGLVVEAGSKRAFSVDLTSPYGKLLRLDRQIKSLNESLTELKVQKKSAIDEFEAAHRAASTKLTEISELIWHNAKIKFGVDLASSSLDVLIAGTKGGWAGVAAEVASKVTETALKETVFEGSTNGDPNPGRAAVDAWFQESTVGAVGDSATSIGIQRGVKETVGKIAKDWVSDQLQGRWPQLAPSTPPTGAPPSQVADAARRSKSMIDRIKSLKPSLKTETFRNGFKEWGKSSLGRKLLVDASKAVVGRRLQGEEMAAWREYIMLDIQARALFGLWQAAANAYWETQDQIQAHELERERILEEYDPSKGQSIRIREEFAVPAELRISLVVPRSAKPFSEIPVTVVVSGVEARRIDAHTFAVSTDALPQSQLESLSIEVL